MRTNGLDYTILTIVIIGAINWGLIGFFGFDLINVVFGNMTLLSRIIYAIVGLSGLYALTYYGHTSIYGNGYNIDFSKVVNTYSGGDDSGLKLLNIKNVNDADANVLNEDINVNIYDLTLYAILKPLLPYKVKS